MASDLVLWWWNFFSILKGNHLGFCKKTFCATRGQIIRISEALQVVCEVLLTV
jgi:hypothetical protein